MPVESFNRHTEEMKRWIQKNKAGLQETLKTLSEYRRGRKDKYCITSVHEDVCHRCCLFCKKVCLELKCWEPSTLKNCPWRTTVEEMLAKRLDDSFKTKKEKSWKKRNGL